MLESILKTCQPRSPIISGDLQIDLFAAKLRLVVERKAPSVYQDANAFFANTFATDGIKTLIQEVFSRLNKKSAGSPVIRLETSFGGGKTHDLIAVWHICQQGRNIQDLERFTQLDLIPDRSVQVGAVDGRDLDPENGIFHQETGITTKTIWGEIAYQIGGIEGYELLSGSDKSGIAPGTSVLERLMKDKPTVIMFDEIARYLRVAKAKTIQNSDMSEQVVAFLFCLMDLAAATDNLVFVYSLASVADAFAAETRELREVISASARQEQILSPSSDIEIYNIVKQRLFESVSLEAAKKAAAAYLQTYRGSQKTDLPEGCKDSQYAESIEQSYPFHPELFRLLTQKIASIPEFQKTRGALRLLARVVAHLWQESPGWLPMIHVHHVAVGLNKSITDDLTTRLRRLEMRPAIQADIHNTDVRLAYSQIQDKDWVDAGKPHFTSWVSRTIFLHSLTRGISSGVKTTELNLSLLMPGFEISFVGQALERLLKVAWYLDFDPITSTYRFKEEPSINKLIAEEKEQITQWTVKDDLRQRRDSIFAKKFFSLVCEPNTPGDVDDKSDDVVLCLMDFDEVKVKTSADSPPEQICKIFENTGESGKFRIYRNRVLFLVANEREIEGAIDTAKEYQAIVNILKSQNRMRDLSESQQKELKNRKSVKDLDVRVSLTKAYRHLFYPSNDQVKASQGLMHYTLPTEDSSAVKGKNNQQEIILKALKECEKIRGEAKVFAPVYVLQRVWPAGLDKLTTKGLRDIFAKSLNLNILLEADVLSLKETISQGVEQGQWDLKMGDRLFIKTEGTVQPPKNIEISDRMELYRRGILEPPKPKVIELNAQVLPSSESNKTVRVRWKAKEALKINLYRDGELVPGNFRPSDEYETAISKNTVFKLAVDYGSDIIEERETTAVVNSLVAKDRGGIYQVEGKADTQLEMENYRPETIESNGSVEKAFVSLTDQLEHYKVKNIEVLEFSVDSAIDYRKFGTTIPLLSKFNLAIDQTATIQDGDQFVRLEYQGPVRGFQGFFTTINGLLNSPKAQADVYLKITLEFNPPVLPEGRELTTIKQALGRNPVEKINLSCKVSY
jgi:hypothetical protein